MSSRFSNPQHHPGVYSAPQGSAAAPGSSAAPPKVGPDAAASDGATPGEKGAGRTGGAGGGTSAIRDHIDEFKADWTARLTRAKQLLRELQAYATHYAMAQLDAIALKVRSIVLYAVLGLVAGLVALTGLIYATVLLLSGIADAIGRLLGDRPWLGAIITGAVVLGGAALAAYLVVNSILGKSRREVHRKYEEMKAKERADTGRDVRTAAQTPPQGTPATP